MLTSKEKLVVQLICMGLNDDAIASKLGNSIRTIHCHKENIKRKINIRHGVQIVRYALKNKIITNKYLLTDEFKIDLKQNKVVLK